MSSIITTNQYPQVTEVRQALSDLKPSLPIIGEDIKAAHKFPLSETHDDLLFTHPILKQLTSYFIARASLYGEAPLDEVRGYIGLVANTQILNYLHQDPVPLRLTMTISDADNSINPSTRTCQPFGYCENFERELYYKSLGSEKGAALPQDIFQPQEPEGSIVSFIKNQYHAETTLPAGTAKLFLSATIRY